MWISDLSVQRPILATVVNVMLVVFGSFALFSIALREYPDIDPPLVSVITDYPGCFRRGRRVQDHAAPGSARSPASRACAP